MYEEVKKVYPDTKLVYWKRPFDSWYVSFMHTYNTAEAAWPKDSERGDLKDKDPATWKMLETVDASNVMLGITVPWRKRDDGTTWASTNPEEGQCRQRPQRSRVDERDVSTRNRHGTEGER